MNSDGDFNNNNNNNINNSNDNGGARNEITLLKSQQYTDKAMFGVQAQLGQQTAWNATQQANLGFLQAQINDALSISRRFVPNANIAPGWGPAIVEPAIAAEVAKTSTTSTTTGN